MHNTIIQLNTDIYRFPSYQDKKGNDIEFNAFLLNEREDSHLTQLVVQASIDKEIAGYISLIYLSDENKFKYFNTPWDFYYNQKMQPYLKNLFCNDWLSFCKEINKIYEVDISTTEEFKLFATKIVDNEYKKFISYYLNKPYPEIVTVYSDKDKNFKNFSEFPFLNIERKKINFLNRGIANAIYHFSCQILKKNNMCLYASNNQTSDGQRMWEKLEKNPKFLTLSDNYWGNLTTDRKNLINIQRKGITI